MELKKLAIALLALYIVYCFMSKEKYAFDEAGFNIPKNDPNVGYIDIFHKKDKNNMVLHKVEYNNNISTAPETQATIRNNKVPARDIPETAGASVIIKGFTSKIPKSVLGYGVFYNSSKPVVASYRPITFINATNIQIFMKPGNEIMLGNLTTTNLGSQGDFPAFKDGESVHTGRFVFTF